MGVSYFLKNGRPPSVKNGRPPFEKWETPSEKWETPLDSPPTHPLADRTTHTCENITFPASLCYAVGNKIEFAKSTKKIVHLISFKRFPVSVLEFQGFLLHSNDFELHTSCFFTAACFPSDPWNWVSFFPHPTVIGFAKSKRNQFLLLSLFNWENIFMLWIYFYTSSIMHIKIINHNHTFTKGIWMHRKFHQWIELSRH